jgi:hypothetical protein
MCESISEMLVPTVMKIFPFIVQDQERRISEIAEVISEIREPLTVVEKTLSDIEQRRTDVKVWTTFIISIFIPIIFWLFHCWNEAITTNFFPGGGNPC